MYLPGLPALGETVMGGATHACLGGKGANQAIAARRAGGDVFFLSCVGDDSIAEQAHRALSENGLDLTGLIRVDEVETGTAMIFVDETGENSIGVASGANAHLTGDRVLAHAEKIRATGILLLQMEIPLAGILSAARLHHRVILNPAPAQQLSDALLHHVSILTPNKMEMEQLIGEQISDENALIKAAGLLLHRGPEAIIITLGAAGVFIVTRQSSYRLDAYEVDVVDTTAAGDVFNGALASALVFGADLKEACEFAIAAAALSVQKPGAIPSIPYREEIEDLLARDHPL